MTNEENQEINDLKLYVDYMSENLNKSISYQEYLAKSLSVSIEYSEFIGEIFDLPTYWEYKDMNDVEKQEIKNRIINGR